MLAVKFTNRYCEEAHVALAELDLAPKLYAVQPCGSRLKMIVMEHIYPSCSAADIFGNGPIDEPLLPDIRRAVRCLHDRGLVFGDLLPNNIVMKPGQKDDEIKVFLIDFEWCGKHGTSRYPATLNNGGDIKWHKAVKRHGIMKMEHDDHLLAVLAGRPPDS
ncbi:hypothetical protein BOTBODRAFT_161437 [Botryobasidium botryosum FD-172 SS1]|uniref:Protein kinase domain-containing protein n=1 Tax=Botryobasidium botryosum (strain FD-172 SS1) TaxID=930990 RepID=A0A067MLT3_BOTB1|nr:hypothetical protein BOTBODRAFT_161437 [Botryobasidium botryosum FD-172 SS1]